MSQERQRLCLNLQGLGSNAATQALSLGDVRAAVEANVQHLIDQWHRTAPGSNAAVIEFELDASPDSMHALLIRSGGYAVGRRLLLREILNFDRLADCCIRYDLLARGSNARLVSCRIVASPLSEMFPPPGSTTAETHSGIPYSSIAHMALAATPIPSRLGENNAVIMERIARGAGATRWYFCSHPNQLEAIEALLQPGSAVSFYFDDRIQRARYSDVKSEILRIVAETGDCVLGFLQEDGLRIKVDYVAGPTEIAEFEAEIAPSTQIFYGATPGRDNDGVSAVTLILPDRDGIVGPHPH